MRSELPKFAYGNLVTVKDNPSKIWRVTDIILEDDKYQYELNNSRIIDGKMLDLCETPVKFAKKSENIFDKMPTEEDKPVNNMRKNYYGNRNYRNQ